MKHTNKVSGIFLETHVKLFPLLWKSCHFLSLSTYAKIKQWNNELTWSLSCNSCWVEGGSQSYMIWDSNSLAGITFKLCYNYCYIQGKYVFRCVHWNKFIQVKNLLCTFQNKANKNVQFFKNGNSFNNKCNIYNC